MTSGPAEGYTGPVPKWNPSCYSCYKQDETGKIDAIIAYIFPDLVHALQ